MWQVCCSPESPRDCRNLSVCWLLTCTGGWGCFTQKWELLKPLSHPSFLYPVSILVSQLLLARWDQNALQYDWKTVPSQARTYRCLEVLPMSAAAPAGQEAWNHGSMLGRVSSASWQLHSLSPSLHFSFFLEDPGHDQGLLTTELKTIDFHQVQRPAPHVLHPYWAVTQPGLQPFLRLLLALWMNAIDANLSLCFPVMWRNSTAFAEFEVSEWGVETTWHRRVARDALVSLASRSWLVGAPLGEEHSSGISGFIHLTFTFYFVLMKFPQVFFVKKSMITCARTLHSLCIIRKGRKQAICGVKALKAGAIFS